MNPAQTDIIERLREELADVRADAALLRAEVERLTKERDDWKELAQLAISERRALEPKT